MTDRETPRRWWESPVNRREIELADEYLHRRSGIARHEAAHALAAFVLGAPFDTVTIWPEIDEAGNLDAGHVAFTPGKLVRRTRTAVVLLAGSVADGIASGLDLTGIRDRGHIWEGRFDGDGYDRGDTRWCLRGADPPDIDELDGEAKWKLWMKLDRTAERGMLAAEAVAFDMLTELRDAHAALTRRLERDVTLTFGAVTETLGSFPVDQKHWRDEADRRVDAACRGD